MWPGLATPCGLGWRPRCSTSLAASSRRAACPAPPPCRGGRSCAAAVTITATSISGSSSSNNSSLHASVQQLGSQQQQQRRRWRRRWQPAAASGGLQAPGNDENDPVSSLEEAFALELAARQAAETSAAEAAAAEGFDGVALLALLQEKYGRSYDLSLVQRKYMGKTFTAVNVMWKYREQAGFPLTEAEYLQRLDYVAAALVAWGAVEAVRQQLVATRERPRVGKAVSLMLDVPEELVKEWIG